MLEHVAELVGLDDPQVDLHARVRHHPRAGLAGRGHGLDLRQLGERAGERGGIGGRGDDVEVLDRLGHAPQRAGDLDAVGRRVLAQRAGDLLGDGDRAREHDARGGATAVLGLGQHLPEVLLDLDAEAAQLAQPPVLDRRAQRVERVDAELVVHALAPAWRRSPGRCMTEIRPTGIFARSFTSAGMSPVSSSASIFSSSVLPMFGSSVTLPSRARAATDTAESRTVRAALR